MAAIAVHVLLRVRAQVAIAERKKDLLARSQVSLYLFSSRPNYGNPVEPIHYVPTPTLSRGPSNASTVAAGANGSQASKSLAEVTEDGQLSSELGGILQESTAVLFPAVRSQLSQKLTKMQAASRRSTALKLVYRNLLLQYAALAAGIAGLGGNALFLTLTMYKTSREVTTMGVFHQAQTLMVCYINVVCVSSVIGAILWRSFDPAFILGADTDVEEIDLPQPQMSYTPPGSTEATPQSTPFGTADSPYLRGPSPFDRHTGAGGSAFRGSTVDLGPIRA